MLKKICLLSLTALSSLAFARSDLACHSNETKVYVKNLSPAIISVDGAHGSGRPTTLINDSHADCYSLNFDHVKELLRIFFLFYSIFSPLTKNYVI